MIKTKKFMALLLSVVMLIGMLPVNVYAGNNSSLPVGEIV